MSETIKDNVKEYYGKILQSNKEVKTNACIQQGKPSKIVRDALELCHDEVVSRYYGCGLVFPLAVNGAKVLDFGSGSGRDCYILSKLVGQDGFVIGIDMTEEQVDVAKKHIAYHMEKFGYITPNVEFKLGYIEKLKEAGIDDSCCDLIISNCVINLSPDKPAVFREAFRVLKEGGELYFSDIYADKELSEDIKNHKELWGECLAGALYWKTFVELSKEIGFLGPYLVNSRTLLCGNEELEKILGDANFVSATYRMFKPKKGESGKGLSVKYTGTIPENTEAFLFDHKHTFDATFKPVSSDVAMALKHSRYAQHFQFQESATGSCVPATDNDPFALAKAEQPSAEAEQPSCCEKSKCC